MPEQEDSLFERTAFQKRKASALAAGGMYRDSVVQFVSVCKAAPPSEYASTRGVWLLSFVVART